VDLKNYSPPSLTQVITGSILGFVFLILSFKVIFPDFPIVFLNIIPAALSMVDFVVHETGHIVFGFAGMFIAVLGGTLAQLFFPTICSWLSFRKKQWISLSFFQFWLGQSLIQISKYIGDAQSQKLKLFSPGSIFGGPEPIHDWHYLLTTTGLLRADRLLSIFVFTVGLCVLCASVAIMFAWAAGFRNKWFT
jgi:hypothetical protein